MSVPCVTAGPAPVKCPAWGLVTGASFRNNVTALAAVRLNMTTLHDACDPKTRLSLLGFDMELPVLAAIGGGFEGVKAYFEGIKAQLTQAMLLTGCASLADIDERILYRG